MDVIVMSVLLTWLCVCSPEIIVHVTNNSGSRVCFTGSFYPQYFLRICKVS